MKLFVVFPVGVTRHLKASFATNALNTIVLDTTNDSRPLPTLTVECLTRTTTNCSEMITTAICIEMTFSSQPKGASRMSKEPANRTASEGVLMSEEFGLMTWQEVRDNWCRLSGETISKNAVRQIALKAERKLREQLKGIEY
jgi:hypothetical protein